MIATEAMLREFDELLKPISLRHSPKRDREQDFMHWWPHRYWRLPLMLLCGWFNGGCQDPAAMQSETGWSDIAIERDTSCLDASLTLLQVYDGDTIRVQNRKGERFKVRVLGIDTPETAKPRDGQPAEPCADEATALTRASLVSGLSLVIEASVCPHDAGPYGCSDVYGRTLAYVSLADCSDLGENLLLEGLANVYERGRAFTRRERYRSAEAIAQRAKRGLHGRQCDG